MGRPIKNTVDYFPHSCNHKKTIFILEQQYGNDGYAFWFKLLELLGSTDKHFIDCNNKSNWRFLQAKTHLSEEKCVEMLNLLVELDAIDKNLWDKKIIWCQNFVDNITDVYRNRRVETPTKPLFYKHKLKQADVSTNIKSQSKVKESKVNKSKEIYIVLSKKLGDLILKRKPDFKIIKKQEKKNYIDWADNIRLMVERDNRKIEKIKEVIEWCQEDDFWKNNILSTQKLRSQFDKLEIKIKTDQPQENLTPGYWEPPADEEEAEFNPEKIRALRKNMGKIGKPNNNDLA